MIRADNRLEQVKEEVLLFAPYTTSILQLSNLIKGSRSSIYRTFKRNRYLKIRVEQLLGSKSDEVPPTLIKSKKKIVSILKSKSKEVVSESENKSQVRISDFKGDRENEKVIEEIVLRTDLELNKIHHKPQQRIEKSLEVCRLIAKGYPVYQACEINELGNSTFYSWTRKYPDVKSIYNEAVEIFQAYKEDEFLMRSYTELEKQLKEREVTITEKIGVPNKSSKITTQTIIQSTHTKQPDLKAIFKVLTTLCSDTFGTEREREKAKQNEYNSVEYSLRIKSTQELEDELKKLNSEPL